MEEDDEPDERLLDWWSKYFASIETLKEVILARVCASYRIFQFKVVCLFQKLRAQEAAQAEADDREDLEIAAEMAGIPQQTASEKHIVFLSLSVQILDFTPLNRLLPVTYSTDILNYRISF